jgi:error-prone DNA polymerase
MTSGMRYAELVAASNFSFLRGASSAEHLVLTSLLLGHSGLGIADRNTVAGVVRAYGALKDLQEDGILPPLKLRDGSGPGEYRYEAGTRLLDADEEQALKHEIQISARGFRLVTGSRLAFMDGTPDIVVYPENRAGWGRLCRLLTLGNGRAEKGECHLAINDLLTDARDLLLIVMPPRDLAGLKMLLPRLEEAAPGSVWCGATMLRQGRDRRRLAALGAVATAAGIPLLASNDVLYADKSQRDLQDILVCIREHRTIETAGRLLEANAERHLKAPVEMARLFAEAPDAIVETQNLLARIDFSLSQLRYEYPDEPVPPGWSAQGWLEELVRRHSQIRYPEGVPDKVERIIAAELKLIAKLEYAHYFLTIHDIVRVAEDKGILCQGRLLCAWHHLRESGRKRCALCPLHLRRAARATRYRCRFRA